MGANTAGVLGFSSQFTIIGLRILRDYNDKDACLGTVAVKYMYVTKK